MYKIVIRTWNEDNEAYNPWHTVRDSLLLFSDAVREAEAYFTLAKEGAMDYVDAFKACETACGQWLDAKSNGYLVQSSMSVHFHRHFGFMIIEDK